MNSIFIWVSDVFLIIISLSFFEVLIPSSNMEKYLKLIFSLIIIAIVLEPIILMIERWNI